MASRIGSRKRRLSLMQAAATSPKKVKVSEEELDKMEESINRQKQLDGQGEGDSDAQQQRADSLNDGTYSDWMYCSRIIIMFSDV